MKIDLTSLSIREQVTAVAGVLERRYQSGAKTTFASDLLRTCKHRAFHTQTQRLAHFSLLLDIAAKSLTGQNVDPMVKAMERHAVVFEIGDEADYDHRRVRILDLPEGDKATVKFVGTGGVKTVSLIELTPVTAAPVA